MKLFVLIAMTLVFSFSCKSRNDSTLKATGNESDAAETLLKQAEELKYDKLGCSWSNADFEKQEKDDGFKKIATYLCQLELAIFSQVNAQRVQMNPKAKPFVFMPHLSRLERLSASYKTDHANWFSRRLHGWYKKNFPNAYELISLGKEDYFELGGYGMRPDIQAMANVVVSGWMNSGGHREPILDPTNSYAGVGIHYEPGPGTFYVLMLFARMESVRRSEGIMRPQPNLK